MTKHYPKLKPDPDRYWKILESIGRTMAEYKQNVCLFPCERWLKRISQAALSNTISGSGPLD